MRLFIAMELSREALAELSRASRELRARARGRYCDPELFHVTLRFLGEREPRELAELESCMRGVGGAPIALALDGMGRFRGSEGDIAWAGLSGDVRALSALSARLNAALADRGFAPDTKPFQPHITIARAFDSEAALTEIAPVRFTARELVLFESLRVHGNLRYIPKVRTALDADPKP